MSAPALTPALLRNGVDMHSDSMRFWELCATFMAEEEDKVRCIAIGKHLKSAHFALFVQSMFELSAHDVDAAIERFGGPKTWTIQIEALLGHAFKKACAVTAVTKFEQGKRHGSEDDKENEAVGAAAVKKEARKRSMGERLMESGELEGFVLPTSEIRDVCEETEDPANDTLTKNDTKAVCRKVFEIVDTRSPFKYHEDRRGVSKGLFLRFEKQLKKILGKPHMPHVRWNQKIKYYFENRTRANAEVRQPLPVSRRIYSQSFILCVLLDADAHR